MTRKSGNSRRDMEIGQNQTLTDSIHLPGCREGCKDLAFSCLSTYLEGWVLEDIKDACIRPEVPFPQRYVSRWLYRGFDPDPIGVIEVWFKDGRGPFTYPLPLLGEEMEDWDD